MTAMKVENMDVELMIANYVQAHGIDDGRYRIHHPSKRVTVTVDDSRDHNTLGIDYDIVSVRLSDNDGTISLVGMSPKGDERIFTLGELPGVEREKLIQ